MKRYIITGGTGTIGRKITTMLRRQGDDVCFLSRRPGFEDDIYKYRWSISKQEMDLKWLTETDTVIHLAGASIADKPWTPDYKKEIYESRIRSTQLLYNTLKANPHTVKTFISASAIGIYGQQVNGTADEQYPAGDDFLAKVCRDWEHEAERIAELGIRVVIIRTGVVLANEEGFIPKIAKPIRYGVGAALGNGKQMLSWIHIDDLCHLFTKAAEDSHMHGPYNAVTPNPVSNTEITRKIAHHLHKPLWLPHVPEFVLKLLFGEMSGMLLSDQRVSCHRAEESGFHFVYPGIDAALANLLGQ